MRSRWLLAAGVFTYVYIKGVGSLGGALLVSSLGVWEAKGGPSRAPPDSGGGGPCPLGSWAQLSPAHVCLGPVEPSTCLLGPSKAPLTKTDTFCVQKGSVFTKEKKC